MTRVIISRDGDEFLLEAKGHATGSEKVCAAVSGMLYALAGWMENAFHDPDNYDIEEMEAKMESADVVLRVKGDVRPLYELTAIGLLQIEQEYPEQIHVEMDENF